MCHAWPQMHQHGLHALLGAGGVAPRCQIVGYTNGNGYDPGPGMNPISVQLQLYVFGEPGPFTQVMNTMRAAMPGHVDTAQLNTVPQAVSANDRAMRLIPGIQASNELVILYAATCLTNNSLNCLWLGSADSLG